MLVTAVLYDLRLSPALAAGMVPMALIVGLVVDWLERLPAPLWLLSFVDQRFGLRY